MEPRTLRVLEFEKICRILADHAQTDMGRTLALELLPSSDEEEVRSWCRETDEAQAWDRLAGGVSLQGATDVTEWVRRAARGGVLSPEQLYATAELMRVGRRVQRSLEQVQSKARTPQLQALADGIPELPELEKVIRDSVGEDGSILDGASSELAALRRRKRTLAERIRGALDELIRNPNTQKYLQEPLVTVRDGRYCVPVRVEFKNSFRGIVHDQSASGQTWFIEPAAIVPLGNELRGLEAQEEREIERILIRLSALVGQEEAGLSKAVECLGRLDFALAKSRLAQQMDAVSPHFVGGGKLRLRRCRHPLIPKERVVPVDVLIGDEYHALIITGPNTGGKTVVLKTAGLLTCMAQAGLFIPAAEGSELSVFERIFADIGDEQSIEQSLSTFSGHMKHIIEILDQVNERSLVLLDEIGAGTDPAEGAALAEAILQFLVDRGIRTIATTHYGDLKAFAYTTPGVMNASVEFDSETLRPTYRLLIGVPGRSNALAVAARLGLGQEILDRARHRLGADDVRVEDMIRQLETARNQAREEADRARLDREEASRLRQQWESEVRRWEAEADQRTAQAEERARRIVVQAEREVKEVLEELRRLSREDRSSLKEHQFTELRQRLDRVKPAFRYGRRVPSSNGEDFGTPGPGDAVEVVSFGQKGTVLEIQGKEALVQIGALKTRVPVAALRKQKAPTPAAPVSVAVRRGADGVGMELDLRGKTVEEAIPEIDQYLDRAVLAGLATVHLIHGKGTGALRSGVQTYLRSHPHVRSFRNGGPGEGGLGVTVVELK
ncbi:endonuclease MutS2 [Kyrpidia spormannii]|uniref:Endonuclease MutS2 n=1 Tax=Kyrpidia spormannii TaxID=2055160 RepID=A0A2K8NAM2_9BACL|nr:endonuclease MutS2 [Kyrpidia spormannii]ATY85492.1 endonuclease MutS2 [Kyrpidia spormannii]